MLLLILNVSILGNQQKIKLNELTLIGVNSLD